MKTDILIIGGGPAGMVTSMSCRAYYPEKKVIVIKDTKESVIPCGIPYIFGKKLKSIEDDMIPCGNMAEKSGIDLLFDKAMDIDYDSKTVSLKSEQTIQYDKLIIATGSTPKQFSCGNIKGVYYISKDPDKLRTTYEDLKSAKNIAVVGTGFIGIEVAMELYESGKNVSILGKKLLGNAFDHEFSNLIEKIVLKDDIKHYKAHLKDIQQENGTIKSITTSNDELIECDALIIAIGYAPNNDLAKKTSISMRGDFIYVDEYMRTTKQDVFAVGDCAEKRDFITKRSVPVMLASTATAEARTAVSALYGIKYAKTFSGTLAIFSTVIDNTCFASAGVTEDRAKKENLDIETATFVTDDRHPSTLADSRKQTIKLICLRRSGVVIGAQIIGGKDIGEMINILGVIIENQVNIYSLINVQLATHPLLTAGPTVTPIAKAAQMLDIKINQK